MKKRLIAILLALALTPALTACGSTAATSGAAAQSSAENVSGSASDSSASAEPADSASSASDSSQQSGMSSALSGEKSASDKPAEKPASSVPSKKPAAAKPAVKPTKKPAITKPVEKPATQKADLSAFCEKVRGREDFPALTSLTGDSLDALYPGLSALKPAQSCVYTAMISAVAAEIALVEVSGTEQVKKAKDIFQARIDYQVRQGAFYPATEAAWKNNAKIVSHGNYVMLICCDDSAAVSADFQALFS